MEELRILFLEDLPSDFNLAKRELEQNGFRFKWFRTDNREGFLRAIGEFKPNLIISDYSMPQFTGMEAIKITNGLPVKIPLIILTGSINEETAVKCLKSGADDYVIKEFIGKLPFAVKEVLRQKELRAQKRKMEQALQQSEENFRQSLASSPLGIRIVNAQGETVYANRAFLNIYDFASLEEFTSTPSLVRYTKESYREHLKRKQIRKAGGEVPEYEICIKRNGNEIRHVKVIRKKVLWNGQKHFQVINQDITQQKQRMLNIITDIVSISTIESGQVALNFSETNINEQIGDIYNSFLPEVEEKGIRFSSKTSLNDEDAVIKTDREKVFVVLTNLVKNAVKYTENGSIEMGYGLKGNFLEFFVKDNGIGIPENRQKAIFERFIQADVEDKMARQGAGLGLSISKAYVEMLGGKIWVESEEGKGASFYFTLPTSANNDVNTGDLPNQASGENKSQPGKLKILIAEDDETSYLFLAMVLGAAGHSVLKAETGIGTVETFKKNQDIDLILMDLKMPNMDGYEATREIRKIDKSVIIIAQTAFALAGDNEKALAAGCNDYLAKPVQKKLLMELIRKYFGDR